MPPPEPQLPRPEAQSHGEILSGVLAYAVFSACWMLLSDGLMEIIFKEPGQIILASLFKGGLYIAVTSWLLYGLLRRNLRLEQARQQQCQAVLQATELNYRSLFDNMMNSVVHARVIFQGETPVDMEYLATNPAFASVTGIAKPLAGRRISEVIPGYCENNPESLEIFGRVAATGEPQRWEHYLRELDRWFSFMIYSPACGEVIIVAENITERKQAEEALRVSEELKRGVLDSINANIAVLDRQGVVVATNHPWQRFALENGHSAGEPARNVGVGSNYLTVCQRSAGPNGEEAQDAHDGILAVLEGRLPSFSLEYPCHSPTRQRWFTMAATPLGNHGQGTVVAHVDITERKLAELALADSERRFRQLFDQAPLPLGIVNQDGAMVAVNNSFIDTFGYTLDDMPTLVEWGCLAYPDPDYRRWAVEDWNLAVQRTTQQKGRIDSNEYQVTCKDGCVRTVVISYAKIGTDLLASFFDITALKRVESELKLWGQSFERANFGLSITDARTNTFLVVNPAYASERGYTPHELVGQPITMVYPPDRVEEMKNQVAALDATCHGVFEIEHVCKDGRRFPVMMDITVIKSADGKPTTRVAYALDITEQKRAEAALRASEERFHDIANASADWIWEVDAQARYTYASDSVDALLGYTPAEILGKTPFDFMPPDEAERVNALFAAISAKRETFRGLYNINCHKDGSLRHVETNGSPIFDATGRFLGYRGLDRDITEAKEAEIKLRLHAEELRRFNRAMVGREVDMIALKQRVNALSRQLGQEPPYPLRFLDETLAQPPSNEAA